jgi:TRAP-type C4-dicarboxylate transport system substrate-binding protein
MTTRFTMTALAALTTALPTLGAAQTTELIFNSYLPPFNETYQIAIRDFSAAIEAESGGTIDVTIPDASLAPGNRQYEMVRDGIADMAVVASSSVAQFVTLTQIGELPGHAPTAEAGSVALYETFDTHFREIGQLEGVVVLSAHVLPGRQILSVSEDFLINSAADMAGAKTWATAQSLVTATEALGAVPLDTEYGELQEFTSKGNLDVLFITPGSAEGAGVLEFADQLTIIPGGVGSISFMVFISEERWNELTEDQRAAIQRAADDLPRRTGAANDESEAAPEVTEAMAGIPTVTLEGEALASFGSALAGAEAQWIAAATEAGIANPQEVLDFYRGVLAREAGG